jgi:uncharacterized protein (TIGR00251 family)
VVFHEFSATFVLDGNMTQSSNPASYLRSADGQTVLSVKLQPRASANEIVGAIGGELKIKVTAPPVDSAANEALVEFLAEKLGCAKSAVRIVRGQTSRHKTIAIAGLSAVEVQQRLRL